MKRDKKWRSKFGASISKSLCYSDKLKNTINKNHINGFWLSSKIEKGFHFRSSWELQAALIFDLYEHIEKYEYENIIIPYTDSFRNTKHIVCDFLLYFSNNEKCLVEIKPESVY